MDSKKKMPKHWYHQHLVMCPACCRERTYRTRYYGDRPTDPALRYSVEYHYDYCDSY